MSSAEELRDLAARLSGTSWWDKFPLEWTQEEHAAFARATEAERLAYFEDLLDRAIIVDPPDAADSGHVG